MKEISHIPVHIEQARNRLEAIRHREHESEECIKSMYYILGSLCAAVEELHQMVTNKEGGSGEVASKD